jgi:hypothetical protein
MPLRAESAWTYGGGLIVAGAVPRTGVLILLDLLRERDEIPFVVFGICSFVNLC